MKIIRERVDDLWEKRIAISNPKKPHRMQLFYDLFYDLVIKWMSGITFTDDEIIKSDYFKYIQGYHPNWLGLLDDRTRIKIISKWRDGEVLLRDIQKNGIKNPIDMLIDNDRHCTYICRGNRRLTIAKALGIEYVNIRYATKEEYETQYNNSDT